jgi:CRP-like cAMP-binding protein
MGGKRSDKPVTKHFEAGDTLITERGLSKGLYLLLRGKVEVIREGIRIAVISQKGDRKSVV